MTQARWEQAGLLGTGVTDSPGRLFNFMDGTTKRSDLLQLVVFHWDQARLSTYQAHLLLVSGKMIEVIPTVLVKALNKVCVCGFFSCKLKF